MELIRFDVRLAMVAAACGCTFCAAMPSAPVLLVPHFGLGHARETQGLRYRAGAL